MKIEFLNTKRKCLVLGMICFIAFLVIGMSRLAGLLFVVFMTRYQTGRKQASLPFILGYTVRNVSGPFIGYLGKRFDPISITLCGCLFSTIGVGACFFAEDIEAVIVLWGIIYGLGYGMATSLIPLILSEYFEDHVDKANGVYTGGACIGAFILPAIADKLIAEYGVSGMFLIFSGILLNSIPATILLRKPENSEYNKNQDGNLRKITSENNLKILKSTSKDYISEEKKIKNLKQNIELSELDKEVSSEIHKASNDMVLYSDTQGRNVKNEKTYNDESKYPKPRQEVSQSEIDIKKSIPSHCNFYSKYFKCKSSSSTPNTGCASNLFQVFLDVTYILILLTQGFMWIVISTVWTIIIDVSLDKGIAEHKGVYILICIGITDMIGRFSLGYITDSGHMSKINFQILCAAGFSVLNILFIFLEGFAMMIISVGFFGLFTGGHILIGVGIINQCIEKEYVIMAIASRYFASALMSFVQAPMIGFFREHLNSYDGLFILLAGISGICVILTWFTPIAARRRDIKKLLH